MHLNKIFFLFLLLFSSSKALYLHDLDIEVELKKENLAFKNIKNFDLRNEKFKNYEIKIILDKKSLADKNYYIKIRANKSDIISSNIEYFNDRKDLVFKINKNTKKEIVFKFSSKKEKKLNLNITPIFEFEYEELYDYLGAIIGISYGIIFCAFLYSFIIYLNTGYKSLLFYSFMQISLLATLICRNYLYTELQITQFENILEFILKNITVIATILFSKEVLSFNKYTSLIQKAVNILIALNIFDIVHLLIFKQSFLYEFISISFVMSFLILLSIISFFQGFKDSIYFILGWILILICLVIEEYQLINLNDNLILAIGLPLESFILSAYLGYKLKLILKEKKQKEKLFIQQNKLASMGEMLNNIAHQWRQPLANLSFINMDLQLATQNNDLNPKYLNQIIDDSNNQIDFMSKTLDDFKGFYQPNRKKEKFLISKAVNKAINIISPSLESINLSFEIKEDKELNSYENEYIQVLLNILTNAKDALLEKNIQNPKILIVLDETKDNKSTLSISDNARGINKRIINKIFEPYFSTKNKNSGIGLYMSKIIIQSHLNGEIKVESSQKGTSFSIII